MKKLRLSCFSYLFFALSGSENTELLVGCWTLNGPVRTWFFECQAWYCLRSSHFGNLLPLRQSLSPTVKRIVTEGLKLSSAKRKTFLFTDNDTSCGILCFDTLIWLTVRFVQVLDT